MQLTWMSQRPITSCLEQLAGPYRPILTVISITASNMHSPKPILTLSETSVVLTDQRSKWSSQSARPLKTGDLVWIVEPTRPRGYYPLARVVKLNFGSDAVARSAEVKTTSGNLVRPVVKLALVLPSPE